MQRLKASHPDYKTCWRYLWRYVVERRLQVVRDDAFLALPMLPVQIGRRLALHDLLQRVARPGGICWSPGGVVTAAEPVAIAEGRDWLVAALQGLLGEAAVIPWDDKAVLPHGSVRSEQGDLVGDLLVPMLIYCPGRVHITTSGVPGKDAMVGIGDRLAVCSQHPLIAEVLRERDRDPALLQHLGIAVAATAARQTASPMPSCSL